ncbi:MAG: glycosyltransferase [Planctomycetaceae bacterium]
MNSVGSAQRRRRVLFVSCFFPPTGGVSVQRVTKFVKYLPDYGWDCSVLTVANPSVPLRDDSLSQEIPPATIIRRARTWEPGYAVKQSVSASGGGSRGGVVTRSIKSLIRRAGSAVLQPDPQVLWRWPALKAGLQLLRETPHDAIIATGPPFSSLLLGATLKRKTGVPLVLDYRDEWGISNAYWENKRPGWIATRVQSLMQRHALRAADLIVATTPASTAAIAELGNQCGSHATSACIYNGFDPTDFPPIDSHSPTRPNYGNGTSRYRLAFVGTLWALNPIDPLITAIKTLAQTAPQLLEQLELVVAGRRTEDQERALDQLQGLPCAVVRLPFVRHAEACQLMRSADALLLLNADYPETHRIVNAKTFEYMAAQRPIFLIAPQGDLHDVVRDLPGAVLTTPSDPLVIADRLSLELERHRCGFELDHGAWDVARFERRRLSQQLAEKLDQLHHGAPTVSSQFVRS